MHGGVVRDVVHLVDESHGVRIAAEKLERELSAESFFVKIGNKLRAIVDKTAPTFSQRREIDARVSAPA